MTDTNTTHTWSCRAIGQRTGVVTVNADVRACLVRGQWHGFTQNGVRLGFRVTRVQYEALTTTITVHGGEDGSLRDPEVAQDLLDSFVYACLPADR
jgi:hypothetical protein